MDDVETSSSKRLVGVALMAAMIAVGAYVHLPVGPVPLSMQSFFVLLAGFILGPVYGTLAVALYLVAGLVGLPVFAGGTSGIAKLSGPTGGFLFGFLLMAAVAGGATRNRSRPLSWLRGLSWGALASAMPFALGVPWLKLAIDLGWREALGSGLLPFLPGAVIKLVLGVATYRLLSRRIRSRRRARSSSSEPKVPEHRSPREGGRRGGFENIS